MAQVRRVMGLLGRNEFTDFIASEPLFPKPVTVGMTEKKRPRLRYKKTQVLAFIELMSR